MAYEGELLLACTGFDLTNTTPVLVVVSGDTFNPCGHALLNIGGNTGDGWYFQVAGAYDYPRYMNESGYQRYLVENGKTELDRIQLSVPDADGAQLTLETLMAKKWAWGVLVHNCGSFVEAVVQGGGGTTNGLFNCPTLGAAASEIIPLINRLRYPMAY